MCSRGFAGRFQGGSAPVADADAGADASDISYKADKRRRNREAAVRFRKNRKLRDDKIRSELEDLRNREKDWRKREEDWRAREAALQADKDRLQSRVDEFQALFNKHNLASAVSGLCVCVAVLCVLAPVHTSPLGASAQPSPSPTARALLSLDYVESPGVTLPPFDQTAAEDSRISLAGYCVARLAELLPVPAEWLA